MAAEMLKKKKLEEQGEAIKKMPTFSSKEPKTSAKPAAPTVAINGIALSAAKMTESAKIASIPDNKPVSANSSNQIFRDAIVEVARRRLGLSSS